MRDSTANPQLTLTKVQLLPEAAGLLPILALKMINFQYVLML